MRGYKYIEGEKVAAPEGAQWHVRVEEVFMQGLHALTLAAFRDTYVRCSFYLFFLGLVLFYMLLTDSTLTRKDPRHQTPPLIYVTIVFSLLLLARSIYI